MHQWPSHMNNWSRYGVLSAFHTKPEKWKAAAGRTIAFCALKIGSSAVAKWPAATRTWCMNGSNMSLALDTAMTQAVRT